MLTLLSSWWHPELVYMDLLDVEFSADATTSDHPFAPTAASSDKPHTQWSERGI